MSSSGALSAQGTAGEKSGKLPGKVSGLSARWLVIAGVLILGLVGLTAVRSRQARIAEQEAAEQAAQVPVITTVTALGRLEPDGEIINLTPPTSVQSARIAELPVEVGDQVAEGQVIAVLDNRDRLQAALQRAERQVDIARANLARVEVGAQTGEIDAQIAEISRLEADQAGNIATQQATIERIRAEVNNARDDFARYNTLYERGGISASERDSRRLTLTTAEQRLAEAQATLSRIRTTGEQQISQARATLDRIEEVRPVDVDSATAELNSAIAAVSEAEANLEQSYVRSPSNGQVLKIHARPGETVPSEGIATLGQTSQMMVVAEVYQDDISKVEPGQSVSVTSTAIPETLTGTVDRIGLQVEQQAVINEDPTENINAKVIEVHIELDDASSEVADDLTNLQVTAQIDI
ncbi:MAG: ABC exporter membrane fusion protein [Cyanobacteria bacterium J06623_4]